MISDSLGALLRRKYAIEALLAIRNARDTTQAQLMFDLRAHFDTTAGLLEDLENLGLVKTRESRDERTKGNFVLTKKGERVAKVAQECVDKLEAALSGNSD